MGCFLITIRMLNFVVFIQDYFGEQKNHYGQNSYIIK